MLKDHLTNQLMQANAQSLIQVCERYLYEYESCRLTSLVRQLYGHSHQVFVLSAPLVA